SGNEKIKMATSVIDYIFRELAVTYLGRNDLSHADTEIKSKASHSIVKKIIEPEFESEEVVSERLIDLDKSNNFSLSSKEVKHTNHPEGFAQVNNSMTSKVRRAIEAGYTGDICTECQSMTMVRNGTCLKCMTCGSTSGCS
ncbi:MAG TPA: hypothetical protein VKD08_15600, partial [Ignavibacteriaceae bacterium]|nr:hypothetical protein [Ignavibacteriaceae bacterium]